MADTSTLPKALIDVLPEALGVARQIDGLSKTLDKLFEQLDRCKETDAITVARAFVVMHRLNDKLNELHRSDSSLGKFGKVFDNYKKVVVPEALEAAGVTHVPLAEGFRVGVSAQTYVSIPKDQRDKAYQWLREHRLGDLITSTVNSSTLSAAMRHMIEEDNLEPPNDLFTVALIPNTSVTRTKK